MKILPIDDKLRKQRERVIKALYEAKKVLNMDLPWVKVRIVEFEKSSTLGLCFIDKNYITISKDLENWSEDYLKLVVWHELAHAYFNAPHDKTCPLMHPFAQKGVKLAELTKALLKVKNRSLKSKKPLKNQEINI